MGTKRTVNVSDKILCDNYDASAPVPWLMRIFGLNYINRDNYQLKVVKLWSLLKNFVTALILITIVFLFYFEMSKHQNLDVILFIIDLTHSVLSFIQYLTDLYYIHKFGGDVFLNYLRVYKKFDDIIGNRNYIDIKRKKTFYTVMLIVSWIVSSSVNFITLKLTFNSLLSSLLYSANHILGLIKALNVLNFICNVLQVEYRLKAIADLLEETRIGNKSSATCYQTKRVIYKPQIAFVDSHSRLNSLKTLCFDHFKEYNWLSKCYLILIEQASRVNDMFGFRIQLYSLCFLMDAVTYFNIATYSAGLLRNGMYDIGILSIVSSSLLFLNIVYQFFSLIYRCEQCYRQNERIIDITNHLLVNGNNDVLKKKSLKEFRDLVQSRPVFFSAANFFRIDYPLMVSIASVIVTYTILIGQNLKT